LGAAGGIAEKAADEVAKQHARLRIAGTQHGYFIAQEEADIAAAIRESRANLVLVGMGFPKQEYWIRRNLDRVGAAVCVGVGGAFDIWSGRLKRAPDRVRRAGLEWLYRLVSEPHRFKRQLTLPRFAGMVVAQVVRERVAALKARGRRRTPPDDAPSPEHNEA
jgi:N-acetylglucosaminyldiphosphoundecaprenol N-acetyl-beta-D-mannosaminyltransferase